MRLCTSTKQQLHSKLFYVISIVSVFAVLSANGYAQGGSTDPTGTGGRHSIQGRIVFPSGKRAEVRLRVRLESSGFGDLNVLSDINGNFSFRSLVPGNYTVVVDGGENYQTVRENVYIESPNSQSRRTSLILPISRPFNVQIYLTPKNQPGTKPGVIDASLASTPKPALDLFQKASEFAGKGDHAKAVELLKEAIALYPSFSLALNELGVQYVMLKDLEKASEAFRSAVNLAPTSFQPRLNYGIALLNQMKFEEAEKHLREANKLSDAVPSAHMYLGIVLVRLKRFEEAKQELSKSITLGGKLAQSHYYLGGIYWKNGEYKRAAEELEKYLELDPKAANADQVRITIKDLRSKS
jgi:Tfp pilus assembly protein PilF